MTLKGGKWLGRLAVLCLFLAAGCSRTVEPTVVKPTLTPVGAMVVLDYEVAPTKIPTATPTRSLPVLTPAVPPTATRIPAEVVIELDGRYLSAGQDAPLTVRVLDDGLDAVDSQLSLMVYGPDGAGENLPLDRAATGVYSGILNKNDSGTYLLDAVLDGVTACQEWLVVGRPSLLKVQVEEGRLIGRSLQVILTVRNERGVALEGVSLTLTHKEERYEEVTDAAGRAEFWVQDGTVYSILAEKAGFETQTLSRLLGGGD